MVPLFPHHPKFRAFLYTLSPLSSSWKPGHLLSTQCKRRLQLCITNMLASNFFFLPPQMPLNLFLFFFFFFTGFLSLRYIPCPLFALSPEGQPLQAAACANGKHLQGSQKTGGNQGLSLTSLFLRCCLWQLLALSHSASSHLTASPSTRCPSTYITSSVW